MESNQVDETYRLPPPGTMFGRALIRHCPRCGSGHLFRYWFKMAKRCPRCDYKFDREEGSSLGAYVINFGFTIGALAILMTFFIIRSAANENGEPIGKWLIAAGVMAFVVPAVCYPFSWTIWTAIDLMLHRGRFGTSRSADRR